MRLRKGENNPFLEEDYFQIQLKEIIDKQSFNKKVMYSVEWMDGRREWVPLKKIQHETEKLNDFESIWWRNKRKSEKEGYLNNSNNEQINTEEISKNDILNSGNKEKTNLKEKEDSFQENVNEEKDLTMVCINNKIKMTEDIGTLHPTNIQIDNSEIKLEDQPSIDKALDNSPFEIKKVIKTDSSQTKKKDSRKNSKSFNSNQEQTQVKNRNPNMNIEKVLLGNKREKPIEEIDEIELSKKQIENVEKSKILDEEIPRIKFPQITILDCEDIEETEYLVQWKKREDGTIPNISFISEKEAMDKFPNILCEFLSKTLKDTEMRKLEFPI